MYIKTAKNTFTKHRFVVSTTLLIKKTAYIYISSYVDEKNYLCQMKPLLPNCRHIFLSEHYCGCRVESKMYQVEVDMKALALGLGHTQAGVAPETMAPVHVETDQYC